MAQAFDEDELIAQFSGVASVPPQLARQYLETNHWDLSSALTEFYTSQEEGPDQTHSMASAGLTRSVVGQGDYEAAMEHDIDSETDTNEQNNGPILAGRRLGVDTSDAPQPIATAPSSSGPSQSKPQKKPTTQKKFATLGDFSADSHGHDDDLSDDDNKQDFFAGGEKSALAVQNPDDIKKKILEKAIKRGKPPVQESAQQSTSHFTGTARTLGGDDAPSQMIEPPAAPQPLQRERVNRVLHFWNDGFSVDDGDLYRSDDPRNAEILNGIRQGRAPLSIMNVQPGQEVDVEIKQHQENYVRPKKKWVPFGGQGNRLGSPTPGSISAAPSTSAPTSSTTTVQAAKVNVDESQPTVNLQIRLGSGTRLPARFNITQTVGDVYGFVAATSPESQNRSWVLMTTFPNKDLTDKSQVLGEMSDLKRGGVVVQKWT